MTAKPRSDDIEPVGGKVPPPTEYGETVPFYHGDDVPIEPFGHEDAEPVR